MKGKSQGLNLPKPPKPPNPNHEFRETSTPPTTHSLCIALRSGPLCSPSRGPLHGLAGRRSRAGKGSSCFICCCFFSVFDIFYLIYLFFSAGTWSVSDSIKSNSLIACSGLLVLLRAFIVQAFFGPFPLAVKRGVGQSQLTSAQRRQGCPTGLTC